ncbi:unnamed protein product [Vitrella brassicaformis CCMP3155]|uniref:Uncharacterized protein n=1 Tax=Vitrella brassicaformis (strain CCMP3155) TaxID=1169540 RepID=A0A0G4GXN7_VITBC|nr:unnamed protein product [Vitrella brassicaformis CCMP3155]|eukprot:CEM35617.1 unnamed protein product [Vitrella brassicaformis CCMP3155]
MELCEKINAGGRIETEGRRGPGPSGGGPPPPPHSGGPGYYIQGHYIHLGVRKFDLRVIVPLDRAHIATTQILKDGYPIDYVNQPIDDLINIDGWIKRTQFMYLRPDGSLIPAPGLPVVGMYHHQGAPNSAGHGSNTQGGAGGATGGNASAPAAHGNTTQGLNQQAAGTNTAPPAVASAEGGAAPAPQDNKDDKAEIDHPNSVRIHRTLGGTPADSFNSSRAAHQAAQGGGGRGGRGRGRGRGGGRGRGRGAVPSVSVAAPSAPSGGGGGASAAGAGGGASGLSASSASNAAAAVRPPFYRPARSWPVAREGTKAAAGQVVTRAAAVAAAAATIG